MPLRFDQIIDTSPPSDWRIEFGATDITDLVRRLNIEKPLPDMRLPQLWSGTLELVQPLYHTDGRFFGVETDSLETLEFDPEINNAWKAYATPIKIFANGRYICVLRLLEDLKYDYTTGIATAQLGHIIRAFSAQKPKLINDFESGSSFNAYGGDPTEIQVVLPARSYAEKVLSQAVDADGNNPTFTLSTSGLSDLLENTFTFGGAAAINGYDTDPVVQEGDIAEVVHEILWVNYSRALVNVQGDTENLTYSDVYPCFQSTKTPTLVLPAQQLKHSVEFTSIEQAATIAETSGTILRALRVLRSEFPKEWISATGVPPGGGSPVTAETTEMDEPNISDDTTTTTFTKRSPEWFVVAESTGTNIITLGETHTEVSDSQGRPVSYTITADLTRSQLTRMTRFSELREAAIANKPGQAGNTDITSAVIVPNAYRDETEWTYDSEGHKESITRKVSYPAQYVLTAGLNPGGDGTQGAGDGVTESYRHVIRYERTDRSNVNPEWWETVQELAVRGAVDPLNGTSTQMTGKPGSVNKSNKVSGVPEPEYKKRAKPITFQSFLGEANVSTFGAETAARRLDISSRYATSGERLSLTAELMLCINQQTRPELLDVTMPMPGAEDDLEPFRIYHIGTGRHVNRTAISCVRAGPRIEYRADGEAAVLDFSFSAYKLGQLASTPDINKIPVQPSTYLLPLTIGGISNRDGASCLTVGVPIIPIELTAFEGTPPYTFTAPGGLPPGLSIVGNQIVGLPTVVAVSTSYTIQVNDSAAANNSTNFNIEVCKVQTPISHYALVKNAVFRQPTRIFSGIGTVTFNVIVGTDNVVAGLENVVQDV